MLRVIAFTKAGKYHLVPVYVTTVTGLPDRAIVAFKDEDEWTLVDILSFYFRLQQRPPGDKP